MDAANGKAPRQWTREEIDLDPKLGRYEILEPAERLFQSRGRFATNVGHPDDVTHWSPVQDMAKATGISKHALWRYAKKDCLPCIRIRRCDYKPSFSVLIPSDPAMLAEAQDKAHRRAWHYTQRKTHRDPEYRKPYPGPDWVHGRRRGGRR
jgi:hypothetical protein